MNQEQKKVLEFHKTFGITANSRPTIPSPEDIGLRLDLITEEFQELRDSLENDKSFCSVADDLGDLLYVIYGAAVTFGIDMEPIFNEIHRSNMSKVGGYKGINGKWIKPPTYSPANLLPIIQRQIKSGIIE